MLTDVYQRKIEYLRLSVTDLCNVRCQYCMPEAGAVKRERENILSFEEITQLVGAFVRLGVRSVRLTGGEPLVRKNLPSLIAMLAAIPGLEDLSLTSNGILLAEQARALREAGLKRINIHLDTLDAEKFSRITRWGKIENVLAGIQTARELGFSPIKLNTVLIKNFNDSLADTEAMLHFAAERDIVLRFIELMPIGPGREMKGQFISTASLQEKFSKKWTLLPYGKRLGRGPAEYFKIVELNAIVGFIHPVSKPFCEQCNRIRLSADGQLQDCLAYDESFALRDLLRKPDASDAMIEEKVRALITFKRSDHGGFLLPQCPATTGMYGIGG